MKTSRLTLTVILLICLSGLLRAEEPVLKYSVSISIAGASLVNDYYFLDGRMTRDHDYGAESGTLEYLFENYYGETYKTGQWGLHFGFLEDRKFSVGVSISGEMAMRREHDSVSGKPLSYQSDYACSIYARLRYSYYTRNRLLLYAAVDAGMTAGKKLDVKKVIPCTQLVPFGISFGKKAYIFGELGFGYLYMGGSFGAGIRF